MALAHIHVGFEVMLYILEGRVRHEYGEGLINPRATLRGLGLVPGPEGLSKSA